MLKFISLGALASLNFVDAKKVIFNRDIEVQGNVRAETADI
jgi:hypothetical protein